MSNINIDDTAKSSSIRKVKKRIFQTVFAAVMVATSGLTLGKSTPAIARPDIGPVKKSNPVVLVDHLMSMSLEGFMKVRRVRANSPTLNWSTDGCSGPARGTGVTFNFNNACFRHDFGYRNYKKFGVFTKNRKKFVDTIFHNDMKKHCKTRSVVLKPGCYAAAQRYYFAVRKFAK